MGESGFGRMISLGNFTIFGVDPIWLWRLVFSGGFLRADSFLNFLIEGVSLRNFWLLNDPKLVLLVELRRCLELLLKLNNCVPVVFGNHQLVFFLFQFNFWFLIGAWLRRGVQIDFHFFVNLFHLTLVLRRGLQIHGDLLRLLLLSRNLIVFEQIKLSYLDELMGGSVCAGFNFDISLRWRLRGYWISAEHFDFLLGFRLDDTAAP